MRIYVDFDDCLCETGNGTTHVSVISKENRLSEIGAEVINQQKEGIQDGI